MAVLLVYIFRLMTLSLLHRDVFTRRSGWKCFNMRLMVTTSVSLHMDRYIILYDFHIKVIKKKDFGNYLLDCSAIF